MKSEAAQGIKRMRCVWPHAQRDCELLDHEETVRGGREGGKRGEEDGCDAADGRKTISRRGHPETQEDPCLAEMVQSRGV